MFIKNHNWVYNNINTVIQAICIECLHGGNPVSCGIYSLRNISTNARLSTVVTAHVYTQ